jgi:hypothetical protein
MSLNTLTNPKYEKVGRSKFRENQSCILSDAKGTTVVVIESRSGENEKYVVDSAYFDELVGKVKMLAETLEISTDRKLLGRLIESGKTIDEDIRLGKLHSFEEAFGESEEA